MKKKNQSFLSENFQFLEVKFSIYLNRRVFIMDVRVITVLLYMHSLYPENTERAIGQTCFLFLFFYALTFACPGEVV